MMLLNILEYENHVQWLNNDEDSIHITLKYQKSLLYAYTEVLVLHLYLEMLVDKE
jgi:hypothetical protein